MRTSTALKASKHIPQLAKQVFQDTVFLTFGFIGLVVLILL